MTTPYILKKEIWREAGQESTRLIEHLEAMYLIFQGSKGYAKELSEIVQNLMTEQEPFNSHLLSIQKKSEKEIPASPQDWSKAENMLFDIASKLMTLQDALEKEDPARRVLEGAGQHLDNLTRLFEQLRSGAPDQITTLNTAS